MKFISTRAKSQPCTLSQAITRGLADDGGLFVPESWPKLDIDSAWAKWPLSEFAERVIEPFAEGDPLNDSLHEICKAAFDFPLPLRELDAQTSVLELFHGPTGSFKDFGARFLALAIGHIPDARAAQRLVMVATSGDTGGAVAGAFAAFSKIPVIILYPKGRISARQEKQLTVWGEPVRALNVEGSFDDCQRMVKEALNDSWWTKTFNIISANSINVGRLLPQMAYFAYASLRFEAKHGKKPGFIVPSGNVGNATAALWARQLGFPIDAVHFSHNANHAVTDFFNGKPWAQLPTIATLANAMDVGQPSNFERVRWMFKTVEELRKVASASSTSDDEIRAVIKNAKKDIWCPHTATAVHVRAKKSGPWIIAATAHPAKFETIIEPLIGRKVPMPASLREILSKESVSQTIKADLRVLSHLFGRKASE